MKKRILILGIILTLVLTLAIPTAAFAKTDTGTHFGATAYMVVTSAGDFRFDLATMTATTTGEMAQGQFIDVDNWPGAKRANIQVTHNSTIKFTPVNYSGKYFFSGTSTDTVTIQMVNGNILGGGSIHPTSITGECQVTMVGGLPVVTDMYWVYDSGDFGVTQVSGPNGRNKLVSASGTWNAFLLPFNYFGTDTLAGLAHFNGTYTSLK
jgi:hypothetical protein